MARDAGLFGELPRIGDRFEWYQRFEPTTDYGDAMAPRRSTIASTIGTAVASGGKPSASRRADPVTGRSQLLRRG
jgi:hypothetical protein